MDFRHPEDLPEFARIQDALRRYWDARRELVALGVLRSDRSVPGDYGEWIAAQLLGLTLSTSGVQRGYDAIDADGQTYQIKTRLVERLDQATSFDFREPGYPFDFLLGVLLSRTTGLLAIVRVAHAAVQAHASLNRGSRRLRWTRDLLEAPWVEVLYRVPKTGGASA